MTVPATDSEVLVPLDPVAAHKLDRRIRSQVGRLDDIAASLNGLLRKAKDGTIAETLGFKSWTAYLTDVFTVKISLQAQQRRELVAFLSGEGMSQRAIAAVVGASKNTVTSDLRQVSQAGTRQPTIGLDGKTYLKRRRTYTSADVLDSDPAYQAAKRDVRIADALAKAASCHAALLNLDPAEMGHRQPIGDRAREIAWADRVISWFIAYRQTLAVNQLRLIDSGALAGSRNTPNV